MDGGEVIQLVSKRSLAANSHSRVTMEGVQERVSNASKARSSKANSLVGTQAAGSESQQRRKSKSILSGKSFKKASQGSQDAFVDMEDLHLQRSTISVKSQPEKEKVIYSRGTGSQFPVKDSKSGDAEQSPQEEFNFEDFAKMLSKVEDEEGEETEVTNATSKVTPEEYDQELTLERLMRRIPVPEPAWKLLDFRIRVPSSCKKFAQLSKLMTPRNPLIGYPYVPMTFQGKWPLPSVSCKQYLQQINELGPDMAAEPYHGEDTSKISLLDIEDHHPMFGKASTYHNINHDAPQMPATSDVYAVQKVQSKRTRHNRNSQKGRHKRTAKFPTAPTPRCFRNHSMQMTPPTATTSGIRPDRYPMCMETPQYLPDPASFSFQSAPLSPSAPRTCRKC